MKRVYNPYVTTTQNVIIEVLAVHGTLSVRRLHNRIRRRCGSRTYQATWKAVKELLQDEQLVKIRKSSYALNPLFLKEVGEFCRVALANCPLNIGEAGFYV